MDDTFPRPRADGRRVLVIGATGQVGRELVAELTRRPGPLDVVAAARSHPDPARQVQLERPETIERLVLALGPNHVILTAAATNVGWCEEHPDESRAINVLGAEAAALAARRVGASFTFISTDYVFDGISGPYGEDEPTNPINVYGAHKLDAEAAVMAADSANLVVRTCQVFGDDPRRTNFVVRVADRLRADQTVEAAGDLFGTPTFAPDLARALAELTLSRASGIWNVAGDTFLSRYELATLVADAFDCEHGLIVEVAADRMQDPVNRPRRAGLRNDRLEAAGIRLVTRLPKALADLAAREQGR
jgi:dTDP-4-dehydrorhamnose reductase